VWASDYHVTKLKTIRAPFNKLGDSSRRRIGNSGTAAIGLARAMGSPGRQLLCRAINIAKSRAGRKATKP
jgi:hypothetical protein